MIRLLIQNWWLLLVRGIFAVAFAIFVFLFLPIVPAPLLRQLAFAGLTAVFSLFAIVSGAITIAAAVRGASKGGAAWLLLIDGVVVSAAGLVIPLVPAVTLTHVIQMIAVTALIVGMTEVSAGLHLRRHITDEWLLVSSGLISIAFAASLLVTHAESTQTVLIWTGLYAFASGLAMGGFALRLRGLRNSIHGLVKTAIAAEAKGHSGAA